MHPCVIIIVDGIGHIDLGYPRVAIFFMTFYRAGGAWRPCPPGSATGERSQWEPVQGPLNRQAQGHT